MPLNASSSSAMTASGTNRPEACNYNNTKLVNGKWLSRVRDKLWVHLLLEHITMIGMALQPRKKAKKRKRREQQEQTG